MGDVVSLFPISLDSTLGHSLVIDICRAAEGLIKDDEVRDKYGLSAEVWRNSIKDRALVQAVRAEKERRVLSGIAVREAACRHLVKAPTILDRIMSSELSTPRSQIEAIKELRQTALGSDDNNGRPDTEKFSIIINLGADHVERHEFDLTPNKVIQIEETPDDNEG